MSFISLAPFVHADAIAQVQAYGHTLEVRRTQYKSNGRTALELSSVPDGQSFGLFTVNLSAVELAEGEFLARTWSENEALREPMLRTGLFEDTGRRVQAGHYQDEVWKFRTPV